jgi:DEAD/DEAH box helicase domain-containing protein
VTQEPQTIVFFDLETQRTFDEVGGRHNIRRLGLSVAVVYSTATGEFHVYTEDNVHDLIDQLRAADLVVGFNVIDFDYEVLRAYTDDPLDDLPTADMLQHVHRALGFRVSLDGLATATLGARKSADGLQAVRWWREGQLDKIIDYCRQDVEVTRQLWEYGRRNRHVRFFDRRSYRRRNIPVTW